MDSLLRRNSGILPLEQMRSLAYNWNKEHCYPPLDDLEFEHQWWSAIKFIGSQIKAGEKDKKETKDDVEKEEDENKLELIEKNSAVFLRSV